MRILLIILLYPLISPQVIAQIYSNIHLQASIAAELPVMGVAGPVTGILQNHLVVAGGANFPEAMPWKGGAKKYHNTIFVYKESEGKWMLYQQHQTLQASVAYAAVCNTPDGILYAGGENAEGISNKTWFLQWNQQQQKVLIKSYPDLPVPLTNSSAVCINNRVYLLGGETGNATSMAFYFLDLAQMEKGWQSLGNIPQPLSHLVLTSINNTNTTALYIMGGRQKNPSGVSSFSNKTYRYHIQNNSWETLADMPYSLSAGTGVGLKNDQIVLFGGDRGIVFNQVENLLVAIASEKDPERKQELIQQKNQLQENHPGFSKEMLAYDVNTNRWSQIGKLTQEIPVTTTAFIWNSIVYIPSGEIKAGVRSRSILQIKNHPPLP